MVGVSECVRVAYGRPFWRRLDRAWSSETAEMLGIAGLLIERAHAERSTPRMFP